VRVNDARVREAVTVDEVDLVLRRIARGTARASMIAGGLVERLDFAEGGGFRLTGRGRGGSIPGFSTPRRYARAAQLSDRQAGGSEEMCGKELLDVEECKVRLRLR
jgi:uncharacterized protein YbjT (DUF2867 family)